MIEISVDIVGHTEDDGDTSVGGVAIQKNINASETVTAVEDQLARAIQANIDTALEVFLEFMQEHTVVTQKSLDVVDTQDATTLQQHIEDDVKQMVSDDGVLQNNLVKEATNAIKGQA